MGALTIDRPRIYNGSTGVPLLALSYWSSPVLLLLVGRRVLPNFKYIVLLWPHIVAGPAHPPTHTLSLLTNQWWTAAKPRELCVPQAQIALPYLKFAGHQAVGWHSSLMTISHWPALTDQCSLLSYQFHWKSSLCCFVTHLLVFIFSFPIFNIFAWLHFPSVRRASFVFLCFLLSLQYV